MLRRAVRVLGAVALATLALLAATHYSLRQPPPRVEELRTRAPAMTEYMRGRPPDEQRRAMARTWTDLASVSPLAACAVVVGEDKNFFDHGGISWLQAAYALAQGAAGGSARGASTITQQLARNIFLTPDRALRRKLAEAVIARQLEHVLSKGRILELYLNLVEWGPGEWSIADASRFYFAKPPGALDAFESAFLAGQLQAPRRPLSGRNLDRAAWEQRRILNRLYLNGAIDIAAWRRARARAAAVDAGLRRGLSLADALGAPMDEPSGQSAQSTVPMAQLLPASDRGVLSGLPDRVAFAPSGDVITSARLLSARCGTDRSPRRIVR